MPLILAASTVNPVCLFRLPINVPSDPVKSILSALIFKSVSPLFTSFVIPSITPVASSSVVIVWEAIWSAVIVFPLIFLASRSPVTLARFTVKLVISADPALNVPVTVAAGSFISEDEITTSGSSVAHSWDLAYIANSDSAEAASNKNPFFVFGSPVSGFVPLQ